MGIVTSIATLVMMPIFGINQGCQPVIGYNFGAGKYERVSEGVLAGGCGGRHRLNTWLYCHKTFPNQIIAKFNDDPALVEFGSHALTVYLMCLMTIGFQIAGSNYFLAVGKPKQSMFLSLSRQALILIPMLIITPEFFSDDGDFNCRPDFGCKRIFLLLPYSSSLK
jgi:Na+-driven multidrug efflux pump